MLQIDVYKKFDKGMTQSEIAWELAEKRFRMSKKNITFKDVKNYYNRACKEVHEYIRMYMDAMPNRQYMWKLLPSIKPDNMIVVVIETKDGDVVNLANEDSANYFKHTFTERELDDLLEHDKSIRKTMLEPRFEPKS